MELQLSRNVGVYELQSRFRDVYYEKLLPVIEQELDKLVSNDLVVRIDTLELDLGDFGNFEEFEALCIENCRTQIRNFLQPIQSLNEEQILSLKFKSDGNIEILDARKFQDIGYFEALVEFIETGRLPWKIRYELKNEYPQSKIQALFSHVMKREYSRLIVFLKRNSAKRNVHERFYHHLNFEQVLRIAQSVLTGSSSRSSNDLVELVKEISSLIAVKELTQHDQKAIFWAMTVIFASASHKTERFFFPVLIMLIAKKLNAETNFTDFVMQVSQKKSGISNTLKELESFNITNKVLKNVTEARTNVEPHSRVIKQAYQSLSVQDWFSSTPNMIASVEKLIDIVESEINILTEEVPQEKALQELKKISEVSNKSDEKKIPEFPDVSEGESDRSQTNIPDEGVSVSNSGLVILWPYLSTLLSHLGWINEEGLLKEDARAKALSLTHYLSFGDEDVDESELMLDKLLLGIDLEEPITNAYTLSDDEKSEANGLISAVIANWSAIGSVSVDGFRGSFLVREGIIYEKEEMYQLVVERKAFDILLEQIPWSISVVRLKWMDKILMVQW